MTENPTTLEKLSQLVDLEEASEVLRAVPTDTYSGLASYSQRLRAATAASGSGDILVRLAKKQLWLVEVMTKRLLELRLAKAEKEGKDSRSTQRDLLPEERSVYDALKEFTVKENRFVKAAVEGQPSFFNLIQRRETQKKVTVRISKKVGEIMGADLKRYGPFEQNDVARIPSANARAMVAGSQAALVSSEEHYE